MHKEFVTFHSRQERMAYVARRFAPLLQGKILDVGCDQAYLRQVLPHAEYTGVDIGAAADVVQNLEQTPTLPFADASFDCVLCIDVLEHLDSLHAVFAELLRVCKTTAVISWHNCWVNARRPLQKGRGGFSHYGLPADPPPDRHKWFFNCSQALEFVTCNSTRLHYELDEVFMTEKPRPWMLRSLRRLRWPRREAYDNRYVHTLWTVLKRS